VVGTDGSIFFSQAVKLEARETLGTDREMPMAAATRLPGYDIDARTARRRAQGVQLGRHEVRGAPAKGLVQLVHGGRMVALVEVQAGLPLLRTVRVFLEGTRS